MFLPIELNQVEQDFEPLLGRETPGVSAIRRIDLGVAIELADNTLHATILSVFPKQSAPEFITISSSPVRVCRQ